MVVVVVTNNLWCFDRDKTLDLNKGPIPLEWVDELEDSKIAIGNQKLTREIDIVGRNWVIEKAQEKDVCPYYVRDWEDLLRGEQFDQEHEDDFLKSINGKSGSSYWPHDKAKHYTLWMIEQLSEVYIDWDRIILVDDANLNFVEKKWDSWEFYYPEHFYWEFVHEYS